MRLVLLLAATTAVADDEIVSIVTTKEGVQRSITAKEVDAYAIYNAAVASQIRGEYARAVAEFEEALIIAPALPEALINLGNAYSDLANDGVSDVAKAAACYERAIAAADHGQTWWPDWGPSSLETGGLGGSEEAVVFVARELAKRGHAVEVYNECADRKILLVVEAVDGRRELPEDGEERQDEPGLDGRAEQGPRLDEDGRARHGGLDLGRRAFCRDDDRARGRAARGLGGGRPPRVRDERDDGPERRGARADGEPQGRGRERRARRVGRLPRGPGQLV